MSRSAARQSASRQSGRLNRRQMGCYLDFSTHLSTLPSGRASPLRAKAAKNRAARFIRGRLPRYFCPLATLVRGFPGRQTRPRRADMPAAPSPRCSTPSTNFDLGNATAPGGGLALAASGGGFDSPASFAENEAGQTSSAEDDGRGMKIICIHCGGELTIRADDLGGQGMCPHCRGLIVLPKATRAAPSNLAAKPERERPVNWLDGAISGLVSLVLHMTAFLVLALWQANGGRGGAGVGEEVQIGVLPVRDLVDRPEEQLSAAEVEKQQSSALDSPIEVEAPSAATSAAAGTEGELSAGALSASGGEVGSFDLGSVQIASGSGGGGSWEGLIGTLRRQGLDIVLCFDSTGSMGGEIDQVKRQIERIGQTLVTLIPKTRIGVCTFRDRGDEYVVKGLPLTTSIQDVSTYLGQIRAGGGGDHPEAVEEGLYWCSSQNQFRPTARKVILLFGDAPPHPEKLQRCLKLAGEFRQVEKGIVSTVTCRNNSPLPAFYEIATAGGGEAFLTSNQREIMTQLMVLVFGSQHRQKVIDAFELIER